MMIFVGIFSMTHGVNGLINDSNNTSQEAKLYLRLDWNNNDIVNGKEFNIKVNAFNLKDKNYDLKVYIYEDDKSSPISQTRDQDFKWISSNLYIKDFFIGPGNESDSIKLRINEKNKALKGSATVIARIRESGASSYIEEQEDIFIYENKSINEQTPTNNNIENQASSSISQESLLTGEVIRISGNRKTETIKTQNNIVYESKNEIIKRYSIYGFIILIIVFLILLALRLV